jgi:hypothetical protein
LDKEGLVAIRPAKSAPEAREQAMLNALNAGKSQRTLFSPAESLNGLTIGAAHSGSAFNGALPANAIDPFTSSELPNVVSAMGLGYRKAVKPDILLDGGRAPVRFVAGGQQLVVTAVTAGARFFGLKAASPAALERGTKISPGVPAWQQLWPQERGIRFTMFFWTRSMDRTTQTFHPNTWHSS